MLSRSRRRALLQLAALGGAAALSAVSPNLLYADGPSETAPSRISAEPARDLPPPERSGIEHIVLVTMENRSFDHFLGWLPNADGKQAGLQYPDRQGVLHPTYPLAPDFQGCGFADPDHSFAGGRVEYDDGRCDGWLQAGSNDVY